MSIQYVCTFLPSSTKPKRRKINSVVNFTFCTFSSSKTLGKFFQAELLVFGTEFKRGLRMKKVSHYLLSVVFMLSVASIAHSAVLHDEALNGDLSNTINAPTSLGLVNEGLHTVTGTMINQDRDYFSVDIGPDYYIESFLFTRWPTPHINSTWAIILNGNEYIVGNPVNVGIDLLAMNGIGLLTDDTFIFGTRTGTAFIDYEFELSVARISVVPLPAAMPLYGAGLMILGWLGRRKLGIKKS